MEENNFEIKNDTTPVEPTAEAPVEPVAPETPVEPAEPVVPVVDEQPVEAAPVQEEITTPPVTEEAPVEPVAPEAPVEPAEPVAPQAPAEPVMPAEPSATSAIPVQPVAEQAPQGVVEQPPKKKGSSAAFIIIVIILVLAICGLGVGLIVLAITNANAGKVTPTTTTTETTTLPTGTSTIPVTTQENTTTLQRTTRSIDTPTPTSVDDTTIKVGYYDLPVPTGYQIYKNNSSYPIIVNKTKKVQLSFYYNGSISYSTLVANPDKAIKDLQSQGCTVKDAASGAVGHHAWMLFLLDYPGTPDGYEYVYGITSLSSGIMETAILLPATGDLEEVVKDVNTMLDNAKSGSSSFAPSISESEDINSKSLDNLDSRLFE